MIILVPILLYIIVIVILIWISNISFKDKPATIRKRIGVWIKGTAIVLFFPLILLYFSYLFGLSLDVHYDVKKGTFLWYATMDNETITDFPQFKVVGKVTFNSIGGDSPNISSGCEIEYESRADFKILEKKIVDYLESEGYGMKSVEETQYFWSGKNHKDEMNVLYAGLNEKGESLDLLLQRQGNGLTKIECVIISD